MTIRKWFYLFWTTLLLGIAAALATGLVLVATVKDFSILEIAEPGFNVSTMLFILLGGATISVLSQMGFFAYQIVRFFALGILRSRRLWDGLQLALVAVTFIDHVYLRYTAFSGENESWLDYLPLPILILAAALLVSIWKVKLTNPGAWASTLFFMHTVTLLEAVPALRINSMASNVFMLVPLLVCNAWQILILPRVLEGKKRADGTALSER